MSLLPSFKNNPTVTMGVELELQLVDLQNYNLAMEAKDFLRRLAETRHPGEIKPEITLAMIEFNSSIHTHHATLVAELTAMKNHLTEQAAQTHIGICGGGTHPFQKWQEQRIFPTERFTTVSDNYGFLAKKFTVFGQHIHIGCRHGDQAIYMCHALARYLPQFIALSAASPFNQGIDTNFDCSRLTVISAFPLSGTPPWLLTWSQFEDYFHDMSELGIVQNMKDFYWDIRPKPEYGTVEIRICDTPLTVEKAADLASYAQMLVYWLMDNAHEAKRETYVTYLINRFNAARYGLNAVYIDPVKRIHIPLVDDIVDTCRLLQPYAEKWGCQLALERIADSAKQRMNDAVWIRNQHIKFNSLSDTVKSQVTRWNQ